MSARSFVVFLAGLASGCTFEAALPASAVIRCDDGVCPAGYACRPRVGRCVPLTAQGSGEAPRVLEPTVRPATLRDGQTAQLEFSASKPLFVAPVVSVVHPSGLRAAQLERVEGARYTYSYVARAGLDTEHTAQVVADLLDGEGNENAAQPVGVVTFDFTPPRLVEADFTAPRSSDDAGVLLIRGGETAVLRLAFSEALEAGAQVLTDSTCDGGLMFQPRRQQGTVFEVAASAPSQVCATRALTVHGVRDAVGNLAPPQPALVRLEVDGTAPVITDLRALRGPDGGVATVFSRQAGFRDYVLAFGVDSSTVDVAARLDTSPLSCACAQGLCRCPGSVGANDAADDHFFFVTATDGAGNTATESLGVSFDFTPPRVDPASVSVVTSARPDCPLPTTSGLGLGASARVVVGLTEPSTNLQLTSAPPGLTLTTLTATPTLLSLAASVSGASPQGPVSVVVSATDAVGNRGSSTVDAGLWVDTSAPPAPNVATPGSVVFRREPWGSRDAGPSFVVSARPGAVAAEHVAVGFGASVLAVGQTVDGGAVVALPLADRPFVWVSAVDSACNASARVDVRDLEWLATLNGKVVGRTFENPHHVEARAVFSNATTDVGGVAQHPPPVDADGAVSWRARRQAGPAQSGHAMAYDSHRGTVVVFGGGSATAPVTNELWEWHSARGWSRLVPHPRNEALPPPRRGHVVAYDSVRRRLVVVGGSDGSREVKDVWEWDAEARAWSLHPSPGGPDGPPAANAMSFDVARRTMVVVSGPSFSGVGLEFWEWDTRTGLWTNQTPSPVPGNWPSSQYGPQTAYDSVRNKLLVYGLRTGSGRSVELWEWDATARTLTSRTPAVLPTAWPPFVIAELLAFDAAANKLVMFGGASNNSSSCSLCTNQLWEWSPVSGAWLNRTPAVLPPSWPAPREQGAATFDAARRRMMVGGGMLASSNLARDLWEWDGATWTNHTPPVPAPAPRVTRLVGTTTPGRALLFGGNTGTSLLNDVWELSGHSWLNRTPATGSPSARAVTGLAFDSMRGRLVAVGSATSFEVWEWNVLAGTWTNRTPAVLPTAWPRLTSGAVAYDSARGRLVWYGAQTGSMGSAPATSELWEWEPASGVWTNRTPTPLPTAWPPPRLWPAMAFDAARGRTLLFSGDQRLRPVNTYVPDLWAWNGVSGTWTNLTPSPLPAVWPEGRLAASGTFDTVRDRFVVFGGISPTISSRDLWEWAPTTSTWRHFEAEEPWPPSMGSLAFDQQRVVAFGGFSGSLPHNELWDWGSDTTSRPGVVAQFVFSVAGADSGSVLLGAEVLAQVRGVPSAVLHVTGGDVMLEERSSPAATPLAWSTTAAPRLAELFEGPERRVSVGVTPQAVNGSTPSRLTLDWVELLVRYRRP